MPPFDAAMAKRHKKGLSAKQVRQWVAVASSTSSACVDRGGSADTCEARAIRAANGVTGTPTAQSPQPFQEIVAHISAATTPGGNGSMGGSISLPASCRLSKPC